MPDPQHRRRRKVPPGSKRVFSALRTVRREQPVLIHGFCTCLSVTGLLLALMSAGCHS